MKNLLVLDLDETLIHATETSDKEEHFIVGPYVVFKRPRLEHFLNFCNQHFEIGIWTSSTQNYADEIVKEIMPKDIEISFLWARDRCIADRNLNTDEIEWVKDLRKLKKKGYNLDNIVVVDDSPEKLKRNYGNLIRINPFFGDTTDDELEKLESFLFMIKDMGNVRVFEKRKWKNKI